MRKVTIRYEGPVGGRQENEVLLSRHDTVQVLVVIFVHCNTWECQTAVRLPACLILGMNAATFAITRHILFCPIACHDCFLCAVCILRTTGYVTHLK